MRPFLAVLLAGLTFGHVAQTAGPESNPAERVVTATSHQPNEFQRVLKDLAARDRWQKRESIRLSVGLGSPQPLAPLIEFTQWLSTDRDLRQARWELHRFWMNNQPSTQTYERLKGAIRP